jgi:hypothetical protein
MSTDNRGPTFRFSIKSILLAIAFFGIVLGWWLQYSQLSQSLANEQRRRQDINNAANELLYAQLTDGSVRGRLVSDFPIATLASGTFDRSLWDERGNDLYYVDGNDILDDVQIPAGGKFVGYRFHVQDDGEGSPWSYFVLSRNGGIVAVARTPASLD